MHRGKKVQIQPQPPRKDTREQNEKKKEPPRVTSSPVNSEIKILSKPLSPNPKPTSTPQTPSLLQRPKETPKIQPTTPERQTIKNPLIIAPKDTLISTKKPIKLLSNAYEMQYKHVSELVSEKQEYKVIGVMGKSNTGKSHILNQILGEPIFSSGTETCGIDLYVGKNDFIFLDPQGIFSIELMSDLISGDSKLANESINYDSLIELITLKTSSFLWNICNILVVLMDDIMDLDTVCHLNTIKMLQEGIDGKVMPKLIFCYNKVNRVSTSVEIQLRSVIQDVLKIKDFEICFQGNKEDIVANKVKQVKVGASEINIARCWDMIRTSHVLIEYSKTCHKLQNYK